MKKGFMRWTVGLLAGGALALTGCGSNNEGGEGGRETGAFRTPTQERQQPSADQEAEPLARDRPSHPSADSQKVPSGNQPRGTPLGGGTTAPNTSKRQVTAGAIPYDVAPGLGTSLADAYQAPLPQGGTATGGAGTAGTGGSSEGGSSGGGGDPGGQ